MIGMYGSLLADARDRASQSREGRADYLRRLAEEAARLRGEIAALESEASDRVDRTTVEHIQSAWRSLGYAAENLTSQK